ncbi:MAG: hypothetical protein M1282_12040 [Chloroflexi bacterium]|nr:hypothetical protein [Chloroflexota bacterium]
MRIEFVRSGGFAGISLTARVDSEKLAPDEKAALEKKISDASFFDLPGQIKPTPPGADMFEYSLTISSPPRTHTVIVSETVVPDKLRPLLDHLTDLARTGKYR